jgi:hypothetical protein
MLRHHYILISFAIIFIILLGNSETAIDSGNDSLNDEEIQNEISFINTPHRNDILDSNEGPVVETNSAITKEMLAWEMIRLSWGILGFGIILIIFIGLITYKNRGWDRELSRIFIVSVVIIAGLFLMTAGYSDKQVAPMFGLLGTMIGYVFGKSSQSGESVR